jgi:putative membrane protein insertion efficiency factor
MAKVLLFAIKAYQGVKGLFNIHTCRFYPSCSDYTAQAIEKYGTFKGSLLGIWRILRCSPLSKGGFDPIYKEPETSVK